MPKAYSYIRFSTPEQAKGDSLRRQQQAVLNWIESHPELSLELDTSLHMQDLGTSAYKGKNREEGALGAFLQAVDSGKVKPGSYLLVESLDRLSREAVTTALKLFLSILEKGITIVTMMDNRVYDGKNIDITDLIISLTIMSRAHEESATKGKRIKKAWDNKKENIKNNRLTKWTIPKWLKLNDEGELEIIEYRADIIRQIFQWTIEGYGTAKIIQKLENLGIEPWESPNVKTTKRTKAKRWHTSYIQRLFTEKKPIGEYVLTKDGKTEVIKDYLPRIVSDDIFYRALNARQSRQVNMGGRKGKYVTNLFSKIAKCGYSFDNNLGGYRCSGSKEAMLYANKGGGLEYLQCAVIKGGNGGRCNKCRKMWRYDNFEIAFFTHIKEIDVSTIMGTKSDITESIERVEENIGAVSGELISKQKRLESIEQEILNSDSPPATFIKILSTLEKDIEELEARKETLISTLAELNQEKSDFDDSYNDMIELISIIGDKTGEELYSLRLRLSQLFQKHIERIEIYASGKFPIDIERVRKELGEEAANVIEQNEAQLKKKIIIPFFVVYYKSGDYRLVIPNKHYPHILDGGVKIGADGTVNISPEDERKYLTR